MAKQTSKTKVRKNKLGPDKRANFKAFAAARTNKVLSALKALSNCGNKANYESTPEEVAAIEKAILNKLAETLNALKSVPKSKEEGFKL